LAKGARGTFGDARRVSSLERKRGGINKGEENPAGGGAEGREERSGIRFARGRIKNQGS